MEPGNSVIFFGKRGDIATNRRDEQELSVLCLRVLQAALVYVNTLMVQDVLADEDLGDRADRRRPARPHAVVLDARRPYGEVKLDMSARTRGIAAGVAAAESGPAAELLQLLEATPNTL